MSYLDRKDLLSANLITRSISKEKAIKYYNTDKNIAYIYMKLVTENEDGAQKEVAVDEASNYTVILNIKKPGNQLRKLTGVLSNDLVYETSAIYKFTLSSDYIDQVNDYLCETVVKSDTKELVLNPFKYSVSADIATGLNGEIIIDKDYSILKELISKVQKTNNINDIKVSETETYSNKKIEEKFSGVDAQFNTIEQDFSSKIKEKANKSEIGSPLIANSISEMIDITKVYVYCGNEEGYINGNWYSHNGTNWISGGVYNSQGIGDKSITPPTTSFLRNMGNLIDNSYFKITKGKYLNGNTGEIAIATGENYVVVENFIPVEVGKTYVFNSAISWLYCYDSAKNFVSRVATTDCSVTWKRATVPEGVSYVRIYCDKSVFNYTKIYLFEYDNTLTYGRNEPTEDKLPQTNYFIKDFKLEDETLFTIKEDVKNDVIKTITYKMIRDFSKLMLNGCKVKLIGNSITAGQGGSNFNSDFNTSGGELITDKIWSKSWYTNDAGHCWANSLRDYLTQKFGCTVKNFGCPGIGVDQMILAIDDLVREDDELVICMIGTNNRHNMQLTEFYSKLKQIYEIITVTKGKKCIMMSCMPASVENELSSNRIFHTEDIDNMYFKLSCEKNIEYISIYKEVMKYCDTKGIDVDTLLNSDGLHPNDNGYDVMFKIVCNALGFAQKRDGATW